MTNLNAATLQSGWRRLTALVREQWIFAALLGLVWCGDVLVALDRDTDLAVLVSASTVMTVLAIFGWRHPVRYGVAAAVTMCLSTGVFILLYADPFSLGIAYVQPAENAAGVLLLLYVFWKRRLTYAIPVGCALVGSCLFAVFMRVYLLPTNGPDNSGTIGLGFLQVILAVGTGLYLRGRDHNKETVDTPLRSLLRRQWPIMAAQTVLLFGEIFLASDSSQRSPGSIMILLGCITMAVLAVIAPWRPAQATVVAAVILTLMALTMRVFGISSYTLLGGIPIPAIGAGMLLIAFVTREAEPRVALRSGGLLVASAVFALFVMPSDYGFGLSGAFAASMVVGGLLLLASVGTGMYFRARAQEQAKSVRDAINHAQQNERLALARELHDVVAHHVTGIVVQAQAAQLVSKQNPHASAEALDRIATSGTDALAAMRRLVSSMRGVEPAGSSGATEQATMDLEADLAVIVTRTNSALSEHGGPKVTMNVDLDGPPPQEVARSALRVVQECLTNSEKHALDASAIQVLVQSTDQHLYLRITDDGSSTRAHPVGGSGGYGLIGMRERVELLGGRFNAGPGEHIGWCVEAWLPLDEQEEAQA